MLVLVMHQQLRRRRRRPWRHRRFGDWYEASTRARSSFAWELPRLWSKRTKRISGHPSNGDPSSWAMLGSALSTPPVLFSPLSAAAGSRDGGSGR